MHSLEKQSLAHPEPDEGRSLGVIALNVLATWAVVALGFTAYFLLTA